MVPMSAIDKDKYPTLYKYWSALRKDPAQPNLPKWMVKNRAALDKEISKWSKEWMKTPLSFRKEAIDLGRK
jgi:hypothetical protein